MVYRERRNRRRGGALAETALVLSTLLTFVLGTFEYGRYMMMLNLVDNASREGCRYALVNNTSTTISTDVTTLVTNYMAGQTGAFTGFSVAVSGTHSGTATAVNNLAPGDLITVTVSGTYNFMNVVPFVNMPLTMSMKSAVTMVCEGGT